MSHSVKIYTVDNRIITEASVTYPNDDTGELTDPTTIVFTVRKESEDVYDQYTYGEDSEVTREDQGIYRLSLLPATGVWHIHIKTTEPDSGGEVEFEIVESEALEGTLRA